MSFLHQAGVILAQGAEGDAERIGVLDNRFLDQWRIPFGDWMDQAINWIAVNLTLLLDIFAWPFEFLIRRVVRDILREIPWLWVVVALALIAWLIRNLKVAAFVAISFTICGLMGNEYWRSTTDTLGFIGVAVLLCVVIGIPIGIACGRVDGIWKVTRPILDAMQVVHSFVYMLPFIWFFGIGEVSATMVTMVFALPPLIRLTNLGIRQVPPDVVEAARAYGASESRVLFDVQIPLARPAIMTGINQTLLLAISMLGIAGLMGAGGFGRRLFQAINNQDVALGASGGLAFFLLAVALDRISQREGTEGRNLLKRIRLAWKHRRDPEMLIPDQDSSAVVEHQETEVAYAPIAAEERLPIMLTLIGGLIAIASVFLPWTSNAGKMSAWSRWTDASLNGELAGQVFNGLAASGGSWFGITVLVLGLFTVLAATAGAFRAGRAPRWLAPDGAVIASFAALIVAASHFLARPMSMSGSDAVIRAADPGQGLGVYTAMAGGLVAAIGAVQWIRAADHKPLHPLPSGISLGSLIGNGVAVLILLIGLFSAWGYDNRGETEIPPDVQAQIEELLRQADEYPERRSALGAEVLQLRTAERQLVTVDGISLRGTQLGFWDFIADVGSYVVGRQVGGTRLGFWALIAGLVAALASFPAAGVFGGGEQRRWRWSAAAAGIGGGIVGIAFAWVFTHVRSGHPSFVSGVGSFLALIGGVFILASTMAVLKEYRRARVYSDPLALAADPAGGPVGETES